MQETALTAVFLPLALVLIMFGVGLDLRPESFRTLLRRPRGVAIGLCAQLLVVPALGLSIVLFWPLKPELAVGIAIIAACPGGAVSNLISYLSRADVALSVTLTALSSLVTVLTIPLIVNFALMLAMESDPVRLPLVATSLKLFALTVAPVVAGMLTRRIRPEAAQKAERFVGPLSMLFLAGVIAVAITSHSRELPEYLAILALPLVALNGAAMASGWLAGKLGALETPQRRSLLIETGIQNGALGITIPAVWIGSSEMAIPPAIYGVLMLLSGLLVIVGSRLWRRSI
jgi:bile acid:Na+ symporter, BASS family